MNAITKIINCSVSCELSPIYPHIQLLPSGLSPYIIDKITVDPIPNPMFIIVEIILGAHCYGGVC